MSGHSGYAWIDASAGVAGDMLLAALIDAGADPGRIQRVIDEVMPGSVRLTVHTVIRAGLRATKVDVVLLVEDPPHRTWSSIRSMLVAADIPDRVRRDALAVFGRLAEAEGHVHGVAAEEVHFHEVGALDSIADVVGVCAALDQLGVGTVGGGPVAVGSGRIRAAHGEIPVPVPAVARLARGWQVHAGGEGELATPTGMALVTALSSATTSLPAMIVDATGSGAGTKDFHDRANVTRVVVGRLASTPVTQATTGAHVLEANVDDLDPRLWPGVLDALLAAGASDAWLTPILMKKGRPAHTLSVLCAPGLVAALGEVIFARTTTLGIREHAVRKHVLNRGFVEVPVGDARVAVKIGHRAGVVLQVMPEFDDVASLAERRGVPALQVLDGARAGAAAHGPRIGGAVPADLVDERPGGHRPPH